MQDIKVGNTLVNDKRRMWKYIIFGILTLGIYDLIFMWNMIKELNTVCGAAEDGDDDRSPNFLLVVLFDILTLGIYNYFWYYKQGNRMKRAGHSYGLEIDEKGSSYLLWTIFGTLLFGIGPLVAMYLFISNLNKLCRLYNVRVERRQNSAAQDSEAPWERPAGEDAYGDASCINYVCDDPTQATRATGKIRCTGGAYAGAEIEIMPEEELVIGRNSTICNLVISEPDISRKHCVIKYTAADGYYYVVDYSTFGVLYNDSHKLEKGVSMKCPVGTKLTLGKGNNVFYLQ